MSIDSNHQRSALFPLHTVLFPGCTLPLQIFEQRYLNLVKTSLQSNHGFAVVLISSGKEVGEKPEVFSVGCHVDIIDWEQLDNGLLGITIRGQHRVGISEPCAQDDGLLMATTQRLNETAGDNHDLLAEYSDLSDTLKHLAQHPFIVSQNLEIDYTDCLDVCNKLAYLLPTSNQIRQSLLEMDNLQQRLETLRTTISQLQHQL